MITKVDVKVNEYVSNPIGKNVQILSLFSSNSQALVSNPIGKNVQIIKSSLQTHPKLGVSNPIGKNVQMMLRCL